MNEQDNLSSVPAQPSPELDRHSPWQAVWLSALILFGSSIVAALIATAIFGIKGVTETSEGIMTLLFAQSVLGLGLLVLTIKGREPDRVLETLAVQPVALRPVLIWCAITLAYIAGVGVIEYLVREAFDIPFMGEELPIEIGLLYVLDIIILAPIFEEALFRGFLLPALVPTRLGRSGAILATSLGFSLLHVQYDFIGMAMIFGFGVILGMARMRYGTVLLPIALHMLLNTVGTIAAEL